MTYRKVLLFFLVLFSSLIIVNELSVSYFSHIVFPFIKALILFADVFCAGFLVQKFFRSKNIEFGDAIGYGLISTTLLFYLLSFFKILSPTAIYLFVILPVLLVLIGIRHNKGPLFKAFRSVFQLPGYIYFFFLFPFIYASLPPTFYDALVYHLGIPNLFLLNGGMTETTQFLYANTSIFYELALIPSVFLGDLVPRFFHFFLGIVLVFEVVKFGAEFFDLKRKSIIFLSLVSIPMCMFLLTTVKNDLLSALFILLGIKHYLKNEHIPSGLFWGFSVGIKYFNILPMGIFFIVSAVKKRKIDLKKTAIFGMIVFCILSPLLLKNIVFQNNPLFPLLTGDLESDYWDQSRLQIMRSDVGTIIHNVKDLLKLPYTISFKELGYGGVIGVQFLVLLPFLFLGIKCRKDLLLFSLLSIIIGSFFTGSIRFLFPAVIFLTFYVAVIYESMDIRGFKFLFYMIISINFIFSFALLERLYQAHSLYSGKIGPEQYVSRFNPVFPALSYVNTNFPMNSKILLVGESRNYYLHRKYLVSSAIDYSIMKRFLIHSKNTDEMKELMKKEKIDFILFSPAEFDRLQKTYNRLEIKDFEKMLSFFKQLPAVYQKGGIFIYSLR